MDPEPALLSRYNQINKFFSVFFCFLLTVGTVTSVFKDNKLLKSHKTAEIKILLNFCLLKEGSESVQIITDPGGPKLIDPLYLDQEHWYQR